MRRLSKDIQSFYPFDWPFEEIVAELPDKGNLIEVGPYLGKSTVTWAECFERAGKEWNIHTIDLFIGISKIGRPDNPSEELIIKFIDLPNFTQGQEIFRIIAPLSSR